jgi:hypothetical protein
MRFAFASAWEIASLFDRKGLKCTNTRRKKGDGWSPVDRMDCCWMLRRNALTITSLAASCSLPFLYAGKKTNSSLALFGSLINNKKCARSLVAREKNTKKLFPFPPPPIPIYPHKVRLSLSLFPRLGIDFDRKTPPRVLLPGWLLEYMHGHT